MVSGCGAIWRRKWSITSHFAGRREGGEEFAGGIFLKVKRKVLEIVKAEKLKSFLWIPSEVLIGTTQFNMRFIKISEPEELLLDVVQVPRDTSYI